MIQPRCHSAISARFTARCGVIESRRMTRPPRVYEVGPPNISSAVVCVFLIAVDTPSFATDTDRAAVPAALHNFPRNLRPDHTHYLSERPENEFSNEKSRKAKQRKEINKMKRTTKVPKSAKTRLSDLTPKKDARGGLPPQPTPPVRFPVPSTVKRPSITA